MTNVSKLFDSKRLEITIDRLCQQIIENHKEIENFILIGLQPRGVYFLDRIKAKLEKSLNNEILTGYLDTTFYRDDLKSKNVPEVRETKIPDSLDGKDVVIVDDVLFTCGGLKTNKWFIENSRDHSKIIFVDILKK